MNSTKNINDDYWVRLSDDHNFFLISLGRSSSKYNPVIAKLALEKIERVFEVFDSKSKLVYDKANERYVIDIDQISISYIEEWSKKFNIPLFCSIQLTERSNWTLREVKPLMSEINNTAKIQPPSLLNFEL